MKYIIPRRLIAGLMTYVPGLSGMILSRGTGGTNSARYCYSVWLRHLAMINEAGFTGTPEVVAELGPGDSLGIGMSALLAGARKYHAMDVQPYAGNVTNLQIFDQLNELFAKRESIPPDSEFDDMWPRPDNTGFPSGSLSDEALEKSLAADRVTTIKKELSNPAANGNSFINYHAPWNDRDLLEHNSVDVIFSQAVLEHVDNLDDTYATLWKWLRPGGLMSHQIDLSAHVFSETWNGHWTFSDTMWNLMKGRMYYSLNREPASTHAALLEKNGFEILRLIKIDAENTIQRNELAPKFRNIPDEDLRTRGVYIICRKPD